MISSSIRIKSIYIEVWFYLLKYSIFYYFIIYRSITYKLLITYNYIIILSTIDRR